MDANQSKHRPTRTGFTLVELLVVIAIIAMLAAMVITGGAAAMRAVKRATITNELAQLSMTLEKYKTECGDYPPDCFTNNTDANNNPDLSADEDARNAIVRHIRKRFPRYRPGSVSGSTAPIQFHQIRDDITKVYDDYKTDTGDDFLHQIEINNLSPASALAFFLGGMPDEEGQPDGFSANPSNPFAIGGSRTAPIFEFDETRYSRIEVDPADPLKCVFQYNPKYIKNPADTSENVPYVYFRARSGDYGIKTITSPLSAASIPRVEFPGDIASKKKFAVPYAQSFDPATGEIEWYKPKSFQIIAAGLDGEFSKDRDPGTAMERLRYFCATDSNLDPTEDDNLTSFTPGKIEDGVQ